MSFMRNFYFLSCHLFHHHFPFSDTFWMGVQRVGRVAAGKEETYELFVSIVAN